MFKRLRIAALLYLLLFAAAAQWLTARRSSDWDAPLRVDIYTVDGDRRSATREYLDNLKPAEFGPVEAFFATEARRHGLGLEPPFRLRIVAEHQDALPVLGARPGPLGTLWWSLRMRWLATSLQWQSGGPSGDLVVFAVFHEPAGPIALDRSTALEKGQTNTSPGRTHRDSPTATPCGRQSPCCPKTRPS